MEVNEYAQARPSPALRPYVAFYSGYRQRGVPPASHRGLPSPYLTLILTLDEPLIIAAHPDGRQAPGRYDALIGGLHLRPAMIEHGGRQSGVQVAVHPLGCRALFGLPASELAGVDVELAAVVGDGLVAALRERLHDATTWPERFARLDAALTRVLEQRHVHPDVAYTFDRLMDSGGAVSVGALAREVGCSARHLTNRFRAEVGLGVKETARVTRFDRARRQMRPGVRLSDVATAAGYYDQAHLTREFHQLAGVSPSRWMASEFPFLAVRQSRLDDAGIGFVQAHPLPGDEDGWHD